MCAEEEARGGGMEHRPCSIAQRCTFRGHESRECLAPDTHSEVAGEERVLTGAGVRLGLSEVCVQKRRRGGSE